MAGRVDPLADEGESEREGRREGEGERERDRESHLLAGELELDEWDHWSACRRRLEPVGGGGVREKPMNWDLGRSSSSVRGHRR